MSNKKFRLYAMTAVALFAMFGVAWALGVSDHTIATTTDAEDTANFDVSGGGGALIANAYGKNAAGTSKTTAEFVAPFSFSGTEVTWRDMVRLPNASLTAGIVGDGQAISDKAAHVAGQLDEFAALGYDAYNDEYPGLNVIEVGAGQSFIIRPAGTTANKNFIGTADHAALFGGNNLLGYLRLDGEGTTTIYAANGNAPTTTAAEFNNYTGGTFLRGGTLKVAHTNSLGLGHVQVLEGATLDIFDADVSLSKNPYGGTFVPVNATTNQQRLILRRNIEASDLEDPTTHVVGVTVDTSAVARTPGEVFINVHGSKKFEIGSMIGESVTGYTEWDQTPGNGANAADISAFVFAGAGYGTTTPVAARLYAPETTHDRIRGARLVKTGTGTLSLTGHAAPATILDNGTILGGVANATMSGAIHTGGTEIREGAIEVLVDTTDPYVAPFGFEYRNRGGAALVPDPAQSAKWNFQQVGAWPGPVTWRVEYNNYLGIGEGASFTTNRDQFFGDFAGAETATFATRAWNAAGSTRRYPQITFQSNGADAFAASPSEETSYFAGLLTGPMDLVVDIGIADQVIALGNDENNITSGDTTIADGILSIAGAGSVGPDTIRVGTSAAGYRDFVGGAMATLHADGTFPVDKPVITDSRGSGIAANLSANRNDTVSYSDVTVNGTAGAGLGVVNLVINNDFSTLTGNTSAAYSHLAPRYMAGTVAFSDKYGFAGTLTNPTRVDIERGTLHLEKTPESGFARVSVFDPGNGLSNSAVLSFGKDANDFSKSLDLVTLDDSRLRVVLRASDLKDALGDAQTSDAVLSVATFTNNLGRNATTSRENRLVFQIDLKEVGTLPGGKYVKLFEAVDSTDWNSLHLTREGSTGATEDLVKIDLAFVDSSKSGQETSLQRSQIEAYLGEHEYAVYLIIKDNIDPEQPSQPGPTDPVTATPDYDSLSLTVSVRDSSVANKDVTFTLSPVTAIAAGRGATTLTKTAPADAQGYASATFSGLEKVQYRLTVTDPDGVQIGNARTFDYSESTGGGTSNKGSGGGGCDAGAGLFGLLAAAGAAALLRKKH
ncbi:MAG: hypothetical protein LBF92_06380 [Synergistaceae bacterium]|jgi:hypothetical protein|nr:hypothetical protein [Synergistaceae bacterium]